MAVKGRLQIRQCEFVTEGGGVTTCLDHLESPSSRIRTFGELSWPFATQDHRREDDMSWPWPGQGLPPGIPLPGQRIPPPFAAPVQSLPPPPPFSTFPPGLAPSGPPLFHPVVHGAPLPPPMPTWLPTHHEMPWAENQPHFQRHSIGRSTPLAHKNRSCQFETPPGRPPPRGERHLIPLGSQPSNKHKSKKKEVSSRDMAVSKEVLSKLGARLPGESKAEIDRWVAERKKNWPSRANVARKLAEQKKREESGAAIGGRVKKRPRTENNALTVLATEYGSSDDGEIEEKTTDGSTAATMARKKQKTPDKRGRGMGKKRQRGRRNGKRLNKNEVTVPRRPNLLRMLLEKEIQEERNILLQAFRYILSKRRDTV